MLRLVWLAGMCVNLGLINQSHRLKFATLVSNGCSEPHSSGYQIFGMLDPGLFLGVFGVCRGFSFWKTFFGFSRIFSHIWHPQAKNNAKSFHCFQDILSDVDNLQENLSKPRKSQIRTFVGAEERQLSKPWATSAAIPNYFSKKSLVGHLDCHNKLFHGNSVHGILVYGIPVKLCGSVSMDRGCEV